MNQLQGNYVLVTKYELRTWLIHKQPFTMAKPEASTNARTSRKPIYYFNSGIERHKGGTMALRERIPHKLRNGEHWVGCGIPFSYLTPTPASIPHLPCDTGPMGIN